jgi:hypothetical protein
MVCVCVSIQALKQSINFHENCKFVNFSLLTISGNIVKTDEYVVEALEILNFEMRIESGICIFKECLNIAKVFGSFRINMKNISSNF